MIIFILLETSADHIICLMNYFILMTNELRIFLKFEHKLSIIFLLLIIKS